MEHVFLGWKILGKTPPAWYPTSRWTWSLLNFTLQRPLHEGNFWGNLKITQLTVRKENQLNHTSMFGFFVNFPGCNPKLWAFTLCVIHLHPLHLLACRHFLAHNRCEAFACLPFFSWYESTFCSHPSYSNISPHGTPKKIQLVYRWFFNPFRCSKWHLDEPLRVARQRQLWKESRLFQPVGKRFLGLCSSSSVCWFAT